MSGYSETGIPGKDELLFLPLGGTGEIGMNLNLYGHDGKWLMVDLGITFGDDTTPGIEVIMPDPTFIEDRRKDLAGLVLTHAHEDHLGAVPYLWPDLECPVYATPFTAAFLRRKLVEFNLQNDVKIIEIPLSGRFSVGPFELELITLTHSIPEPNAVVIRTPVGRVMHTGDWKLDPDPLVGPNIDEAALIRVGEEGCDAMVCDSTNAMVPGDSGSEGDVRDNLMDLVGTLKRRVVVACFASNVARLETIAKVGQAHGRQVALVGRSLWRIYEAAQETGYLRNIPRFVSQQEVRHLPPERTLLICTGSQGEPRAALPRIAVGDHQDVSLEKGDAVIFSSRVIPGNERAIARLQNNLTELGVDIVTARDAHVHVSGHPAQDELIQMYQWIRPRIAVPVHGEPRHLVAHARLARECQVNNAMVIRNGSMVRIAPGEGEVIDEVHTGRLAYDGNRIVEMGTNLLRDRRQMSTHGLAVVTIAIDKKGRLLGDPQLTIRGVYAGDEVEDLQDAVHDAVDDAIKAVPQEDRLNDEAVREAVRRAVRRCLRTESGKNPHTDIHVVRV